MTEDEKPFVVFSYTRKEAIEDGVLVDVSEMAKEAGFKLNTCVNDNVWAMIQPSKELRDQGQDVNGRLWDVLWMALVAARLAGGKSELTFRVILPQVPGDNEPKTLKMVCGPGDNAEAVITIMRQFDD